MKTPKLLCTIVAALVVNTVALPAADLFLVSVRGTCRSTDGDRITRRAFNNNTLLSEFAATQETETDPRQLRLVYDVDGDRLAVATKDGALLGSIFDFGFPTTVANSLDTQRERHVFLFPSGGSDAVGSAVISERIARDNEGALSRVRNRGTIQFIRSNGESGASEICSGTFTTSRRLVVVDDGAGEETGSGTETVQ